ncbi:hypothetical protein Tco_1079316 [Tanacetum coccineum]|uniref:Retrovirus-related Pol polyprotein from transposon TNT 1-94-like beta-barrel domain-containing protein n=1 Tax=Tanacetum coccineum TaxID=301880 RepID=A0ABQ5HRF8_9ASTR
MVWCRRCGDGGEGGVGGYVVHCLGDCKTSCEVFATLTSLVNDNLGSERLIQENDLLVELVLSQDIVHICVNSPATLTKYAKMEQDYINEYSENLMLKAELAKKKQMVEKEIFDEVVLECIPEFFKINEWQAKLDAKDVSIAKLRKHIKSLKEKKVIEKDATPNKAKVIASGMFKLDLEPLSPKHSMLKANSESICATCNGCFFDVIHDSYVLDFVNDVNACSKSKSSRSSKKKTTWKPTGKVFTTVGSKWIPTGQKFTIEGNRCPLTRITSTNVVPSKNPLPPKVAKKTPTCRNNPEMLKDVTNKSLSSRSNVVQIVLWYLDSECSKQMTGNRSQLTNFVHKFLGTVRFGNDQISTIIGYGDYQMGNVTISRVYYVEGL